MRIRDDDGGVIAGNIEFIRAFAKLELHQGCPAIPSRVSITGDLNDAALRAARTWTYSPATKDGVPVKVWKQEKINFTL